MLARGKRSIAIVLAVAVVAIGLAWPDVRAAAFLVDMAGTGGVLRRALPVRPQPVSTETLQIPTRHGLVDARVLRPSAPAPTVVLFPGVHAGGFDEPRLRVFATRLAASGITLVTVLLPDFKSYTITSRSTDIIEDATVWTASQATLAPSGRVGLIGVSFSGGLALVAAGRPSLTDRLSLVLALGAHGDLARAMHYLCTGVLPDGTSRPPHEYGLAILAIDAAAALVPPAEATRLQAAIRTYLDASLDESTGQERATALLEDARRQASEMPEPARSIVNWVTNKDLVRLGAALDPFVDSLAGDSALSPERSPATRAPVFLVQGSDDNVIPSTETPSLAAYLTRQGNTHVRWLLTPALSHVGLERRVPPMDAWRLLQFWRAVEDALN